MTDIKKVKIVDMKKLYLCVSVHTCAAGLQYR